MNKPRIVIVAALLCGVTAASFADDSTLTEEPVMPSSEPHNLRGISVALGGFDYVSVALGLNWGEGTTIGHHPYADGWGVQVEYSFGYEKPNELHGRWYAYIAGGVSAIYMGISAFVNTNFTDTTVGLAPEIGIGMDIISLFYRYNFHFNTSFNCHEIVFRFVKPLDFMKPPQSARRSHRKNERQE